MIRQVPSSWDEFIESALAGFAVNTFTWAQATQCLDNPRMSFTMMIVIVMVALELMGMWWSVTRDRIELRFIEAIVILVSSPIVRLVANWCVRACNPPNPVHVVTSEDEVIGLAQGYR